MAVQAPRQNLRSSVEVWIQGRDPNLESRQVFSGLPGWALQTGGGEILRQHGGASRQLLSLELETHALELGPDGAQERYRRTVSESSVEARTAVWRNRTSLDHLQVVLCQSRRR